MCSATKKNRKETSRNIFIKNDTQITKWKRMGAWLGKQVLWSICVDICVWIYVCVTACLCVRVWMSMCYFVQVCCMCAVLCECVWLYVTAFMHNKLMRAYVCVCVLVCDFTMCVCVSGLGTEKLKLCRYDFSYVANWFFIGSRLADLCLLN
jgi:hypothetical protein